MARRWKLVAVADRVRRPVLEWLEASSAVGLNNVQMAGLVKATMPELGRARRAVWWLALAVGVVLASYYLYDRLHFFLSKPVDVTLAEEDDSSDIMPAITICLNEKYDFMRLYALWKQYDGRKTMPKSADKQLLDLTNLTYADVWQLAGYRLDDLVTECRVGPVLNCSAAGVWTPVMTQYGLCYSYTTAPFSLDGLMYGIHLSLSHTDHPHRRPFKGYLIGIHDPKSPASLKVDEGVNCNEAIDGRACSTTISVSVKSLQLLDRASQPCDRSPDYNMHGCLERCMHQAVVDNAGCRLPYMSSVSGPQCTGSQQTQAAENSVYLLLFMGQFNVSSCNCSASCAFVVYNTHSDTCWSKDRTAKVKVFLNSLYFERMAERFSYHLSALVSNTGGLVGLLLGASLLTLAQLVEVAGARVAGLLAQLLKRTWAAEH